MAAPDCSGPGRDLFGSCHRGYGLTARSMPPPGAGATWATTRTVHHYPVHATRQPLYYRLRPPPPPPLQQPLPLAPRHLNGLCERHAAKGMSSGALPAGTNLARWTPRQRAAQREWYRAAVQVEGVEEAVQPDALAQRQWQWKRKRRRLAALKAGVAPAKLVEPNLDAMRRLEAELQRGEDGGEGAPSSTSQLPKRGPQAEVRLEPQPSAPELRVLFEKYDTSGDGLLQEPEVQRILADHDFKADAEYITNTVDIFGRFDQDGNGGLGLSEFAELWKWLLSHDMKVPEPEPQPSLAELRELFEKYDTSGDGLLQEPEVEHILDDHNFQADTTYVANTVDIFGRFDQDGNGGLGLSEFAELWKWLLSHDMKVSEPEPQPSLAELRELFEKYDTSGDGLLQEQEVQRILADHDFKADAEYITNTVDIFGRFDQDGNGGLGLSEFAELWKWLLSHGDTTQLSRNEQQQRNCLVSTFTAAVPLGITLSESLHTGSGGLHVHVEHVKPNSAAAQAGVQQGMKLLAVGSTEVSEMSYEQILQVVQRRPIELRFGPGLHSEEVRALQGLQMHTCMCAQSILYRVVVGKYWVGG
jgi:Ca2+-binding EF-hand superfamily protein